jgi:hypothetical protein
MSVFSVEPKTGSPVTVEVLDGICEDLGVKIKDKEKEEYRKLLGVFHESCAELMAMDGMVVSRIASKVSTLTGFQCRLHSTYQRRSLPSH